MVAARDWLLLAHELSSDPREVAARSAASRAYYAAFWHCRDVAETRFGPLNASGPEVHAELAAVVGLSDSETAIRLRNLRIARNRADYSEHDSFTVALGRRCVAAAREVLATV